MSFHTPAHQRGEPAYKRPSARTPPPDYDKQPPPRQENHQLATPVPYAPPSPQPRAPELSEIPLQDLAADHRQHNAPANVPPVQPANNTRTQHYFYTAVIIFVAMILAGAIIAGVALSQRSGDNNVEVNNQQPLPPPPSFTTEPLDKDKSIMPIVSRTSSKTSTPSLHSSGNDAVPTEPTTPKPVSTNDLERKSSTSTSLSIPLTASGSGSRISTAASSSYSISSTTSSVGSNATLAAFSISRLSQLASSNTKTGGNKEKRRVILWQIEDDDLVALDWAPHVGAPYRISDRLQSFTTPKGSTPLASAADSSGAIHVFYLDTDNTISHIYEPSAGEWNNGKIADSGGPIAAHRYTRLSATQHQSRLGDDDITPAIALTYQDRYGKLKLAVSSEPISGKQWSVADVHSLVQNPTPIIGLWDELGHAITSGGVAFHDHKDENEHNRAESLIMAVEGRDEVLPWECTIDFPSRSEMDAQCWWLNATAGDAEGLQIPRDTLSAEFAWARLSHPSGSSGPSSYDFSLLSLNSVGGVVDNRVSLSIFGPRRAYGTDFDSLWVQDEVLGRQKVEALSASRDEMVFVRTGNEVLSFRLKDEDWFFDAFVNTTLPETSNSGRIAKI